MKRSSAAICLLIIGVCGGLLIHFVQRSWHYAGRVECVNNLKQLGITIHAYHDANGKFPLAISKYLIGPKPQKRIVDLPVDQCASWLFEVHPYVEARMDPRFWIDINKPWDAEENRYVADNQYRNAQCPTTLAVRGADFKRMNSYIGTLGVGRDAGTLPADDRARGLFGFQHHVRFSDVKDGHSTTMALAETASQNGRWIAGGYPTARGLDVDGPDYLGRAGQFSSPHDGITNVGMLDASVRQLTDRISPSVFEAMATIAGGEKIDPQPWK